MYVIRNGLKMNSFENIQKVYGITKNNWEEGDILDDQDLFQDLYELYLNEMPYGTAKARDGDPGEWIFNRVCEELGI